MNIEKVNVNQYHSVEEWLKAIKKINWYGPFKDIKMCLVLEIVILKGFKVSQFNKFTGSQCAITYLRLHHTIIVKVIHEKKIIDASLSWKLGWSCS